MSGRVNQQVQHYEIILKKTSAGVLKLSFSLGLALIFFLILREFGIRKSSKEFLLCHSFRIYGQSIRLVVKEAISSECGAEVDHEVVY